MDSETQLKESFRKLCEAVANSQNRLSCSINTSSKYENDISLRRKYMNDTSYNGTEDAKRILLFDFMKYAGEPITWVESIELWYDMTSTNISELPSLHDSLQESISSLRGKTASAMQYTMSDLMEDLQESTHGNISSCDKDEEREQDQDRGCGAHGGFHIGTKHSFFDSDNLDELETWDMVQIARMIKDTYGIRQSDDMKELYFVSVCILLLWIVVGILSFASSSYSENESLGNLTWEVIVEAFILFIAELIWECILSAIVLKYDIKINYTRKLGNLLKIPKYFVADFLPFCESTAISLVTALAVNQTLFCIMYYRKMRERIPLCSYIFLSQDRREDRPDTLIFQVTEDLLRFVIYIPFKLFIANKLDAPEIIFIPIAVNNIGDGLAEPIGVAFGRHKYSTTALYHRGKFFASKFTRSYEGSSCVFFTTAIVVAIFYNTFSSNQFWVTISLLPLLMTVAEAKAPHTNDGPFLALIGCGFLTLVLLYV